jgi:hypothetical protein
MLKVATAVCALLFALAGPVQAQGDALAKCLADNTTGKDRKDLARWIFVAMAAHPEIHDIANPTEALADRTYVTMGNLVTRLLAENCPEEVKAVVKGSDSSRVMRQAFERLGQLAMMELMSNRDVASSVSRFEQYVDKDKLASVLSPK